MAEVIGLEAHAAATPQRVAIAFAPIRDGALPAAQLTFGELDARSRALAGYLRSSGLERGDTVALLCENRPEFLEICWAAHRAGLSYVPIATGLTVPEVRFIVEDSGARGLITTERLLGTASLSAPVDGVNLLIDGSAGGFEAYEDAIDAATPLVEQSEGAPLLYSSGTSGRPKGVEPAPSDSPWGSDESLARRLRETYGMASGDVYLSPAPLYHSAPLLYCLASHRNGATVVLVDRFDALGCLELIDRHRVTHSQWVPTMFQRMLELPAEHRDRFDLSSHRVAIHGAAPCPRDLKQRLMDWWGPIVWEYYSATERVGVTSISPAEWLERPGSVGRGIVGTPHVCDEDGTELPAGEVGTIWFSDGPTFTYRNAPEQTAGTTDARGWRTVRDLGWLDDDGFLYLADRRSDLIITGGVNVYPREVESVLLDHPDVADAAVFGLPDERFGRTVAALVASAPGHSLDLDDLQAHCAEHLAAVKRPRRLEVVDQIPRTETGKLRRRELGAHFEHPVAASAASTTTQGETT